MKVLITSFKKTENGRDTIYVNGKPSTITTSYKLPLQFGYGSYNEPKVLLNSGGIQVQDIISVEAEGEMSPISYKSNQLNGDMAEQFNETKY